MSGCDCRVEAQNASERRVLWIALGLNAAMALVGAAASWVAESTGLLADALDMLSDATAYAIGLSAIGRTARFKANSAYVSGLVLLLLGLGVLVEVGRRAWFGSEPESGWMMGVSLLSLVVNVTVLRMLTPLRAGDVNLRASWIFTRADVVANGGVLLSGALVALTDTRYPDLIIGSLIGMYVAHEATEILLEARQAKQNLVDRHAAG